MQLCERSCALQAQRKDCTACAGCSGFQLWFRPCDANDPQVMLHCSVCGCPAHVHSVDQVRSQLRELVIRYDVRCGNRNRPYCACILHGQKKYGISQLPACGALHEESKAMCVYTCVSCTDMHRMQMHASS